MDMTQQAPANLRRVVRLVAILNLAYFGIEFAVALAIGSVALFADSIDFLEDAMIAIVSNGRFQFLGACKPGWGAITKCTNQNGED